jgi:hypothetical protein
MFSGIWRDLVHAGRSLAKARAFTFVCVVSLGIGMAPVIAIPYGARILKMPPPGVNTDGLVELVTTPRGSRGAAAEWSETAISTQWASRFCLAAASPVMTGRAPRG